MKQENERNQNRKRNVMNVECADEFGKKQKQPVERHRDIEIGSENEQRKQNFEFARDNYNYSNRNMMNPTANNLSHRNNSSYELDSLRDKKLEEGFEYEFADDLYATSNNLNNQRNHSNINDNNNNNNQRNQNNKTKNSNKKNKK